MEYQPENKVCQNCKKDFIIEPEDFIFYEKIKVPPPTFCPECRLIRRLIMRDERVLYKRKCDMCGKDKIIVYPPDSQFKIYCRDCFHGDNWDAIDYGKDFDYSKTFFEQYIALYNSVPRVGVIKQGFSIDSEYTNRVTDLKNCYLIFAAANNIDCSYGFSYWDCNNSMDCLNIIKCEKCYWCNDCFNCNGLNFSRECQDCINSSFLMNCRNCQNCFGCVNLRNKNYYIFNKPYAKEDYLRIIESFNLQNKNSFGKIKDKVNAIFASSIVPAIVELKSVDSSGNWIENSKNIKNSFGCNNVENGKNLFIINDSKDVMDFTYWGKGSELIYDTTSAGIQCSNLRFCNESWNQLIDSEYCHNCLSSSNLFGCVGLKNKKYCILNKQYTKENYEKLVSLIKKQMFEMPYIDKVGREIKYGEFFPCDMVPFAYNETIAQEYFPKTKEEVLKMGFRWKENDKKAHIPTVIGDQLTDNINEVNDSVLNEIIGCVHKGDCSHQCTEAFKITPDELQFYRINNIPLPEMCPNCRHYERLASRNPIKLWHRKCMRPSCNNEFETSYDPNRTEKVYCLECYRKEVI